MLIYLSISRFTAAVMSDSFDCASVELQVSVFKDSQVTSVVCAEGGASQSVSAK